MELVEASSRYLPGYSLQGQHRRSPLHRAHIHSHLSAVVSLPIGDRGDSDP